MTRAQPSAKEESACDRRSSSSHARNIPVVTRVDIASQCRELLQTFVWWGQVRAFYRTNLCTISRLCRAINFLSLGVPPLNLASSVDGYSHNVLNKEFKKNTEGSVMFEVRDESCRWNFRGFIGSCFNFKAWHFVQYFQKSSGLTDIFFGGLHISDPSPEITTVHQMR